MQRIRFAAASIAVCASLLLVQSASAQTTRSALVIGNGAYASLPALSACARSAHAVAAALRALGFEVTEREDASSGGIDAGIGEFSRHAAAGPGAAFVYICGYGTSFNNRPFLLPTTANVARPSDVLTQGVLAKSLLDTVSRDPATTAVVAFDLVPKPDGPPQLGLDALAGIAVPDGVGIVAASEATPPMDTPTPFAAALVAGLAGPTVRSDQLLAGMQTRLATGKVSIAALHMPVRPDYLAGAPPPPPPPPPPKPAAATAVPAPAQAAAPPPPVLPDDAQMTDADRRAVQTALGRLGYYDRTVDGVFGPETRAAIRRYQHEIGAEMTGRLTSAQASRLVSTR